MIKKSLREEWMPEWDFYPRSVKQPPDTSTPERAPAPEPRP